MVLRKSEYNVHSNRAANYPKQLITISERIHKLCLQIADGNITSNTLSSLNKELRAAEQHYSNLVMITGNDLCEDTMSAIPKGYINIDKEIVHCVLPCLLPHKKKDSKIYYSKNQAFSEYSALLQSAYEQDINIPYYNEKIMVAFVNYYEPDDFMIDPDNLDYKPFIDAIIKNRLVKDDSSKYLSMYSTSFIGEQRHSEAYIGKIEDIIPIIRSLESC